MTSGSRPKRPRSRGVRKSRSRLSDCARKWSTFSARANSIKWPKSSTASCPNSKHGSAQPMPRRPLRGVMAQRPRPPALHPHRPSIPAQAPPLWQSARAPLSMVQRPRQLNVRACYELRLVPKRSPKWCRAQPVSRSRRCCRASARSSFAWSKSCTSALSARKKRSAWWPTRSVVRARAYPTQVVPTDRSFFWAQPGSARPSFARPWPGSCLTAKTA